MPLGNFQSSQERAAISSAIAKSIGRQLQQVFEADACCPMGDRLADCVRQIEERESRLFADERSRRL
jgi:hypothetical protein